MVNRIIRRVLLSLLGDERYLYLVSRVFLILYRLNLLRNKYPEIYMLDNLIKEGNTCIDIGANVGYYSIPMAELSGKSGKVYAIEPIPMFRKILVTNLKRYGLSERVEIIPYALGDKDNETLTMGTPSVDGLVHFGYTKVLSDNDKGIKSTYTVKMFTPETIFKDLEQLHFIKCDVEGYESHVIPHFKNIIRKFKPVLQIEICPEENRKTIFHLLENVGYKIFYYDSNKLNRIDSTAVLEIEKCDFYFLPNEQSSKS
jgi:FkbM family methyltransferase